MRAILERDFFTEVTARRFFSVRTVVAGAPLVGILSASWWSRGLPPDIAGRNTFVTAGTLVIAALLLTIPPSFASAIAKERVSKAIDVLLTTPLSRLQILLGIWTGRALIVLLLAVTTLPFVAVSLTMGGVTTGAFGAWVLLVALTLLWASVASLAIGTLVRDVVTALRGAFLTLVIPCFVIPLLADTAESWFGGLFTDLSRELVWVSPFRLFDLIGSTGSWNADVSHALAIYAAFSVGVCCVAVPVSLRRLSETETGGARHDRRSVTNPARIERRPMVWLGMTRRRRLAGTPGLFAGILAILVFEYAFYTRVTDWASLTGGATSSAGATAWFHVLYMLGYLLAAAILGASSGATTFHRETAANTMQVLFSTPLSNGIIIRGLYVSAFLTSSPLVLFSWIHGVLAAALGALPWVSVLVFVPMSGFFFAFSVAHGLRVGPHERSPSRAASLALLAILTSSGRAGCQVIIFLPPLVWVCALFNELLGIPIVLFFAIPFLVVAGCWLPTAVLIPLLTSVAVHHSYSWMTLTMLIGIPVHTKNLRVLLHVIIPRLFVVRHDPKAGSRTWIKQYRVERRGMAHDGQFRPEWH
jgi:ABC-type transport system involved in multi-copper enzyme maturation permease subunit